jgi:hypothetical protein
MMDSDCANNHWRRYAAPRLLLPSQLHCRSECFGNVVQHVVGRAALHCMLQLGFLSPWCAAEDMSYIVLLRPSACNWWIALRGKLRFFVCLRCCLWVRSPGEAEPSGWPHIQSGVVDCESITLLAAVKSGPSTAVACRYGFSPCA